MNAGNKTTYEAIRATNNDTVNKNREQAQGANPFDVKLLD